jgi:hypothetical protein
VATVANLTLTEQRPPGKTARTLYLDESAVRSQDLRGRPTKRDPVEAALRDAARERFRATRAARRSRLAADDGTHQAEQHKSLAVVDDEKAVTTAVEDQTAASQHVQLLERWDGIVLDVGDKTFRARLIDERGGRPRAEAEIFLSEVPPRDKALLRQGAVFYWHIGYRDPEGDRERVSRIRFRRLPPKTKADLRRAERLAEGIRTQFGWA